MSSSPRLCRVAATMAREQVGGADGAASIVGRNGERGWAITGEAPLIQASGLGDVPPPGTGATTVRLGHAVLLDLAHNVLDLLTVEAGQSSDLGIAEAQLPPLVSVPQGAQNGRDGCLEQKAGLRWICHHALEAALDPMCGSRMSSN